MRADPQRPVVWVVDDSNVDRQRAERALTSLYGVEHFADGSEVLERLATDAPPAVMVLDWVMPGVSGIDVVHFMRSEAQRVAEVPILLLTAQQRPDQIIEGLNAGANDYLSKPYAAEELQARVAALLRSAAMYERAAQAERAVRELLFASPDALVALDVDGRVIVANGEAGRVFACDEAQLAGEQIVARAPQLADALRGGSERIARDVEIGTRTFAPSVRAVETGSIHRVLALRDVTERRHLEARRLDLYSIVAHDLRSPLGALLLRADNILDGGRGPLEPKLRHDVVMMMSSCHSMVAIIDDFLDLAKADGESTAPRRDLVDLAAVATTVGEDLRPLALAKGMTLEIAPFAGRSATLGDPARLGQVVSNLIGNAIKYSPPGTTVIVAGRELIDEGLVELSVKDEGPGVPTEAIPTLFDRFTRVETGKPIGGTGLGLMIVRQIVEAHGGRAGVECAPGAGSRFWVRLPCSPGPATPP